MQLPPTQISQDSKTTHITIPTQEYNQSLQTNRPLNKFNFSHVLTTEKFYLKWQDVCGLQKQKQFIKQHLILPIKFPMLFTNKKINKRILMYGPPGTGKTYLMKAVMSLPDIRSFLVRSPNIYSLNQQSIMNLFEILKSQKPEVIFFDDFQAISCKKQQANSNEKLHKIQNILYDQIQKLYKQQPNIFIIAITNLPWEIQQKFITIFSQRIYINIPPKNARYQILKQNIMKQNNKITQQQYKQFAQKTEGYICSDLLLLIRDAQYQPVRKISKSKKFRFVNSTGKYRICDENENGDDIIEINWSNLTPDSIQIQSLSVQHLELCYKRIKPSMKKEELQLYQLFYKQCNGNQ